MNVAISIIAALLRYALVAGGITVTQDSSNTITQIAGGVVAGLASAWGIWRAYAHNQLSMGQPITFRGFCHSLLERIVS